MAQSLMRFRQWWLAGLLVLAGAASAEVLVDPTRPPTALIPAHVLAAGETTGPVLQSVLVSRGRRIAIISGKEVREKEKFNGARVVRISDTEVILRNGRQVQTLRLFPDVGKQKASTGKQYTAGKRSKDKRGKE